MVWTAYRGHSNEAHTDIYGNIDVMDMMSRLLFLRCAFLEEDWRPRQPLIILLSPATISADEALGHPFVRGPFDRPIRLD